MKTQNILLLIATMFMVSAGNTWAGVDHRPFPVLNVIPKTANIVKPEPVVVKPKPVIAVSHPTKPQGGNHHKAPEISASSSTDALALLTGVLLLAAEKIRSRRT